MLTWAFSEHSQRCALDAFIGKIFHGYRRNSLNGQPLPMVASSPANFTVALSLTKSTLFLKKTGQNLYLCNFNIFEFLSSFSCFNTISCKKINKSGGMYVTIHYCSIMSFFHFLFQRTTTLLHQHGKYQTLFPLDLFDHKMLRTLQFVCLVFRYLKYVHQCQLWKTLGNLS